MTQMCSSLSDDLIPLEKTDFLLKTGRTLWIYWMTFIERGEISIEQINDLEKAIDQNKRDQVSLQQHLKDHIHEEGSCPLCGSVVYVSSEGFFVVLFSPVLWLIYSTNICLTVGRTVYVPFVNVKGKTVNVCDY